MEESTLRSRRLGSRVLARVVGPSAFYLNVSYVTLGTALSQGILFGASVVLARIYTPSEFGEYSIALAAASILALFATLQLDKAVPIAKDNPEAQQTATAAIASAVAISLLTLISLVALSDTLDVSWLANLETINLYLIPPTVLAISVWTTLRMLQSRHGNFGRVSTSSITSSVTTSAVQVGLGFVGVGAVGLMAGYLIGRIGNAASLLRESRLEFIQNIKFVRAALLKWRRFSIMMMPPNLFNTAGVASIAPFVSAAYGLEFAGLFAFATRILAVPAALIGQAVAIVFYPKMAEMERTGRDPRDSILRATTGLLFVGVPIFGIPYLFGQEIFVAAFGPGWRAAGTIAMIISPWLVCQLISSPLSGYLTVKREWGRLLSLSLLEVTLRLGAFGSVAFGASAHTAVALYSGVGVAISIYYVGWCLRLAGSGLLAWARTVRAYLVLTSSAYLGLSIVRQHLSEDLYLVAGSFIIVVTAAWALVWLRSNAMNPVGE